MNYEVHEVLDKTAKLKNKSERVEYLKSNKSGALMDILRGSMDDRIVWLLPEGKPPYEENQEGSVPSNFIKECVNLAYLVKGGKGDDLLPVKREQIFIRLLESIHPRDAEFVIDMINKKAPKNISKPIVKEAFPGLLPD